MTNNLTCNQVGALLSFYIDDKLSSQLKQFVAAHLEICPLCREKYETLKTMMKSLREIQDRLAAIKPEEEENSPQYDEFKLNLSAYVDNELSDSDNIKVKKYVIANPKARDDLEKMYSIKKALHESFERTKNESKDDFSKFILKRIDIQEEIYSPDVYPKVVAIFILLFAIFTFTAVVIFWI